MAALSKTSRTKVRVIVGILGLWIAIAIATALWPRFPSGNCPDTPPDTAYVCRVAFGQDFEKASRRRNVLVVLEIGVLLSVGSALWLLSDKPLRRRPLELETGHRMRQPADAPPRSGAGDVTQPPPVASAPVSPSPAPAVAPPSPAPVAASSRPALEKARRGREEKRATREARKKEKLGRRAENPSGKAPKRGTKPELGKQTGGEAKA